MKVSIQAQIAITIILIWGILFSLTKFIKKNPNEKNPKFNVLFIAVDDLRPELGAYGNEMIKTPSMDKFADQAVVFQSHYVQVPTCGASRASMLTGLLPRTPRHLQNSAMEHFLSNKPEGKVPETFVHLFRRNGYHTVGIGKISHSVDGLLYGYEEQPEGAKWELPYSWDEMLFDPGKWGTGWNAFFGYADGSNRQSNKHQVKPYEQAEVSDQGYPDGLTADLAMEKLQELAENPQPFFMGVGFFKPHLPFTAPKKYWDLYEEADIPLSPVPDIPENIHMASLHNSEEFNQYRLGEEKAGLENRLSEGYARKLRHAYYASVSYVDAQVGKVMDELERLGLSDQTIVVLWGDHGWHLGDHRVWGKHTLFETSLRSPLIIRAPGISAKVISPDKVVSSIDIYPTLMELCGIKLNFPLDGQSLVTLTREGADSKRENVAFSYFNQGISMRTDRFRLTKYFRDQVPTIELYDHQMDPWETKNIAGERPELVKNLMKLWEKGDTGLYQ
ncbi:MAG: sulfatase [Anditalea sp.]